MIYFNCGKKMHYLDVKQFLIFISGLTLSICLLMLLVNFWKYPEKYCNTWKYQLYNEIKSGDKMHIEYYKTHYIDKGVYLYGENEESESDFINLSTVTGFEATGKGVLLHTEDGNGYFIER